MQNQLIKYLQLIKHISAEDEQIITSYFEHKFFKEGDYLFKGKGRVNRELYFVCKGVIRIMSVNDKGTELTHFFYNENNFCSIFQSFKEEAPTQAAIQASCDADILCISKSRLTDLFNKVPFLKEVIDELNEMHLIEKVNVRNAYLGEDAENQYKLFVMQNPDIALRVPLKDIASYLGITPQSLSRIRKHLVS